MPSPRFALRPTSLSQRKSSVKNALQRIPACPHPITAFTPPPNRSRIGSPARVIFMSSSQEPPKKARIFSKSLKKLIGMATPVSADCTQYVQRPLSDQRHPPPIFPSLQQKTSPKSPPNRLKRISTHAFQRDYLEKWLEDRPELARSNTNQSSISKLSQTYLKDGGRSKMEWEVDDIMNEVIAAHSPKLPSSSAIGRSISTKKFKNVRVLTDGDEATPGASSQTNLLIKQILQFMLKHSKSQRRRREEDPEVYNQDLSRYSPIKLVKKSQQLLGLHPIHEFARQKGQPLTRALNSETYIRQLRAGKLFVREVQLKRH